MAPKSGVKKRLLSLTPVDQEGAVVGEGGLHAAGGDGAHAGHSGLRRRVAAASAASSTAAAAEAASSSTASPETPLFKLLRNRWAKGALPSHEVQQIAAAAESSGARGISQLEKIATSGKHRHNAQRDLMRALGRPQGAPELFSVAIPMAGQDNSPVIVDHPFILPHQFFSKLFQERKDKFIQCVQGGDEERNSLWELMAQGPILKNHPTLSPNNLAHCIPIGLHGDAGKFSHQDSLFVITWNSLVGQGTTREKRFIITVVRKKQMLPDGSTLESIFRVVAWSLNALLEGKTPAYNEDGTPSPEGGKELAGPWKGACVQVRGDWQFYSQAFGFPQWNSAENMCWLCKASNNTPDLYWTNFNSTAPWRSTLWTHETYLEHLESTESDVPALFSIIGLRVEAVMVDVLHAVDQGVAAHIIADIFFDVLPKFGGNQQSQLQTLNRRIKNFYKSGSFGNKSRLQGDLTFMNMKTAGGWPKLKAKAAATRHLAPFAAQLSSEFNTNSPHDRQRQTVIDCLVAFYDLVSCEDRCLSSAALKELAKIGFDLCSNYACLAAEARQHEWKRWKLVPKFHLFQHLCFTQAASAGNPRFFWTYPDEDMVGQMIEAAKSCHPATLAKTALYKYLVMMFED